MSHVENISVADQRLQIRANLIVNVTEDILVEMEDQGLSKAELAKKLGKSRSFVTQVLSGSRNLTLNSLADICFALGSEPRFVFDVERASRNVARSVVKLGEWDEGLQFQQPNVVSFTQRKAVSVLSMPQYAEESHASRCSVAHG